ncbi:hypothetical protein GYMLUDRAFT_64825 [Collybiopsis luxurians FD-317 M1]|uniref:Uncharacterized protein n=1 Tax=Collybiopsis luxurians FD-317 M1 TaxID=944289 RepID=A0A0D0C179_9AGAR|nr:hypothetical protein GYMLUDRAFT_64825 [Collybiopsis luxurians FD-317 M1]
MSSLFFGGRNVILFLNPFGFSDAHYPLWLLCADQSPPILCQFTSHFHLHDCIALFDTDWMHFTSDILTLAVSRSDFIMPSITVIPSVDALDLPCLFLRGRQIITTSLINVRLWNKVAAEDFASLPSRILYHSDARDDCVSLDLSILDCQELGQVLDFISMGGHITVSVPLCEGMPVTIIGGSRNRYWGHVIEIVLDSCDSNFHTRPHESEVSLDYPPSAVIVCLDSMFTAGQDQFVTVVPLVFAFKVPNPLNMNGDWLSIRRRQIGLIPRFAMLENDCVGQTFD